MQRNHDFLVHFIQQNHDFVGWIFLEKKKSQPLSRGHKRNWNEAYSNSQVKMIGIFIISWILRFTCIQK